jgi:hypothetical protein
MIKKSTVISCVSLISISILLSGCFEGTKRQMAETKARGTIEGGGYTWDIPADSAGGNTIQTSGLPSKQAATEASTKLCKKYGRIAQFVNRTDILLLGVVAFDFNCVR